MSFVSPKLFKVECITSSQGMPALSWSLIAGIPRVWPLILIYTTMPFILSTSSYYHQALHTQQTGRCPTSDSNRNRRKYSTIWPWVKREARGIKGTTKEWHLRQFIRQSGKISLAPIAHLCFYSKRHPMELKHQNNLKFLLAYTKFSSPKSSSGFLYISLYSKSFPGTFSLSFLISSF